METKEMVTDAELIDRFRLGEKNAFGYLMQRYRGRLREIVKKYCPDPAVVDDLLQDSFMKLYTLLAKPNSKYSERGYLKTYMHFVARSVCIDYIRKNRHMARDTFAAVDTNRGKQFDWNSTTETESVEDLYIQKEEKELLERQRKNFYQLLRLLPDSQKEVIIFRTYANDFTFREIASLMNRSFNTTLGDHKRGMVNIHKLYQLQQSFVTIGR